MIRRLVAATVAASALILAPVATSPAYALNEGCSTYAGAVIPEPGMRVTMRPPMDNPYRGTGTITSVDDEQFVTVDRDVADGVTATHEYVRFCDDETAGTAAEWGYWSAWPLVG